jgi:hypothetical protein
MHHDKGIADSSCAETKAVAEAQAKQKAKKSRSIVIEPNICRHASEKILSSSLSA